MAAVTFVHPHQLLQDNILSQLKHYGLLTACNMLVENLNLSTKKHDKLSFY